ncbi:hypothetical protein [Burkholderia sp. 22PA0106]|uniref:hypothetical protein n=1 Tax=Burkholderia sp. 22PA0106 TaxID=3237371 RepID=UPI0039C0FF13
MTTFELINLGNDNAGTGGDSYRSGNDKMNRNLARLERTVAGDITYVADTKALDATHLGKRVGLLFQDAGKSLPMPVASTTPNNSTILLWNLAQAVSIVPQNNEGIDMGSLQNGDWALYQCDNGYGWHCVARGRIGWNEIVSGNLSVRGAFDVANTITTRSEIIGGAGSDEGRVRLGGSPGYFYSSSAGAGFWGGSAGGSFQFTMNDKKFRINGSEVAIKSGQRNISLGSSASEQIPSNGSNSDQLGQVFGFAYTHPTEGAGVLFVTALMRLGWLSGNAFFLALELRLYDTVAQTFVVVESWGVDFNQGDMGLYWAKSVSIPLAQSGLIPGRNYEIRLYAGKTSDGRCQIGLRGAGVAF